MNTILQIRIDNNLKAKAAELYENMGLDLSTAIRIFLKKSVAVNGLPFDINSAKLSNEARAATEECNKISAKNGNCNMTLEEINEIIADTRKK